MVSNKKGCRGKRKVHTKKIKFHGNQHTNEHSTTFVSTSAKKLRHSSEFDVSEDPASSYCILAFTHFFLTLSTLIKCKKCNSDISFTKSAIRGLGFKVNVQCNCGVTGINSCKLINNAYEINRRIVFVMRVIGVGLNALQTFCSLMDLCPLFNANLYYSCMKHATIAAKSVADIVLKKAGEEEKQKTKEEGFAEDELTVSGDGTWSKRGFSSLMGVTTLIGKYSKKILDVFVSSKVCKTCEIKKKALNPQDFEIWYESEHMEDCSINYKGSSGGMEVQGIISMFKNSMSLHNAKYAYYIGDGDSKTFSNLTEAKPYGDFIIQKLECVLHVGKRMFRNLKEVKKSLTEMKKYKRNEEKEGKLIKNDVKQPKKKKKIDRTETENIKTTDLTGAVMKKMSLYYSLAIQRHPDSLENMKNEIWSTYYHMISTDDLPQHDLCNAEWCKYLQSKNNNTEFKHKPALSKQAQEFVKPVYERLTNDELLRRCLGRNTQNNNECYNKTLWAIVPKHNFVGKEVVEFAANLSLSIFNEGRKTILKMMEVMGISIGLTARRFIMHKDDERIKIAEIQHSNATKEGRTDKKKAKELEEEASETAFGLLYGPGIAD